MVQTICPASDGTVVFAARNLYNNMTGSAINFVDACNSQSNFRKAKPRITSIVDTTKQIVNDGIKVFPNPTKGVLNIQFSTEDNSCKNLSITDIYGRLIIEKLNVANKLTLEIKAKPGVYFVNIVNCNTGKNVIKKITLIN